MNTSPRAHQPVTGRHLLVAFSLLLVIFAVTHLMKYPGSVSYFREATGGQMILDMKPSSSAAETYQRLDAMGALGRALYLRLIFTVDFVFPIAMLAFLITLARFVSARLFISAVAGRALIAVPALYFVMDLLENASALAMLSQYPERLEGLAAAIGYLTRAKRAFMLLAFIAPPGLLAISHARRLASSLGLRLRNERNEAVKSG